MRKYLIAGNWKMNMDQTSGGNLVAEILKLWKGRPQVEVAVCPPSVYLSQLCQATQGSPVSVGAQNMYHLDDGAYTGEISGKMLKDVGCKYVILGHSERRQLMGETDAMINLKVHAAFKHGLIPIVCIGETLEQREAGQTQEVVETQCRGSLANLTAAQMSTTVLAYEPVWAIGTGRTATPAQAQEVHQNIRRLLTQLFDSTCAEQVCIQYGGSVKADNAAELMRQADIDGALVGGASLKADSFLAIANSIA